MKKFLAVICVAVFTLAMTACGSSDNQNNAQNEGDLIGADKAIEIALDQVDGAKASDVVKSSEGIDDGVTKYEVEIVYNGQEYDFEIEGTSGRILEQSSEVIKDNGQNDKKYIGEKEAIKIALAQVDGAKAKDVVKAKKDLDDGVAKYEIEIIYNEYDYDFEIDAESGKILEQDSESIYDD